MTSVNLNKALFDNPKGNEVVAIFGGDQKVLLNGRSILTNGNPYIARARAGVAKNSTFVMSRAPLALAVNCVAREDGILYGEYVRETQVGKFSTDGNEVRTDLGEHSDVTEGYRLAIAALAAWYEAEEAADMESLRVKIANGGTVEKGDFIRYSDAFYYGYAVPRKSQTEVVIHYNEVVEFPKVEPEEAVDASKNVSAMLPWFDPALSSIPNDASVASALAGKYNLSAILNYGVVEEGGEEFDLAALIVPSSYLNGYVDNEYYRTAVRQMVGTISSAVRTSETEYFSGYLNEELTNVVLSTLANILLVGEPGGGKTSLVKALSATFALPLGYDRAGRYTEESKFTEEVVVTESGFRSRISTCALIAKYGGIWLCDDLSGADQNSLFAAIGGLMETPFVLKIGTKQVKRHPLCFIFGACNIGTEGSFALNEALLTRFSAPIFVNKLGEKTFKESVKNRVACNTGASISSASLKAIVDWVYDAYESARTSVSQRNEDLANNIYSLRSAIALAEKLVNNLVCGFGLNAVETATCVLANPLYAAGEPEIRDFVASDLQSLSTAGISGIKI